MKMATSLRKRAAIGVVSMLGFALTQPAAAQDATVQPQPVAIDGATSRVYKSVDGVDLRLHIFTPPNHAATAAAPAIVFFFGGAWTGGTVNQFVPQSKHFASRGMVAVVADYRVFNRHKTTAFEAIADGKSAIRWVRAHARELGIDPKRIAAAGGSSGGHVALSAAVLDAFDEPREDRQVRSKPNALVLFNPAVDTTPESDAARSGGRASEPLKGRFGGRGREGSPFHHLRSGLVPTLILHGKGDTTIPYSDVERFCAQARKLGNRCELVGYEGATHGFFNPTREWYRETLAEADRFLTTLGYLRPLPPAVPAVFLPAVFPASAHGASRQADADFARLQRQLKVGDAVVVSIRDGPTIKGRLADTSDTQIAVLADGVRREVSADQVTRVQRRRNGILLGAIIGAAVGIPSGMAFKSWARNEGADETRAFLFPLAVGLGTGICIDALLVWPRTVFERPPSTRAQLFVNVGPGRMAARMTLAF